jgi:hypothetical protein
MGASRGRGFLHIHQAVKLLFATTGREQHSQAQAPQRTAAFSPIGGIQHPHLGIVRARAQRGRELAYGFFGKEAFHGGTLFGRQRPEALAKGNQRLAPFNPFIREIAVRREKRHPFIRLGDCCLSHSANHHISALPGYPAVCLR